MLSYFSRLLTVLTAVVSIATMLPAPKGVAQDFSPERQQLLTDLERERQANENQVRRYTPKHCSWLNQIEIWFSGLSRRVLRRGDFDSLETLKTRILDYITFYNQTAKPMNWKCSSLHKKTN